MTSQAQAFSPFAQLQGSFFKQPHMSNIHSDAKSAFTTTTLRPPSVEFHPIFAPGEFHYIGRFDPFEDHQENVEEQQKNPYAQEDSMQPFDTSNVVDANAFENPRPAPYPTVLTSHRLTETRSRNSSITTAVASAADAVSIQPSRYSGSLPSRQSSALTIGQEDSHCATPTPGSPEAHETRNDRGRKSFRIAVHTECRDLSPTSIITEDGQRVRVTDTPVAWNMRMLLNPWEWHGDRHCCQSREVHDSPQHHVQSPALSNERPIFTDSFDGNKEIECHKTPSGGLIYSTERAWNIRNAPKAAARQHKRKRHYFGSDEDEVYVPLGRVIRSKFSD